LKNLEIRCNKQILNLETTFDELTKKYGQVKNQIKTKIKEDQKEISDEITKIMQHS